jgi:hypothetical protein
MQRLPENGLAYGPYGGLGYFERRNPRAVSPTPFRLRRFLRFLASLVA